MEFYEKNLFYVKFRLRIEFSCYKIALVDFCCLI